MPEHFNKTLVGYLKSKQNEDAFQLVLNELATSLVQDRENFVEILNNAGVPASMDDSDVVLIEKFTQNAVANQKLLVGAAMLINYRNRVTNFDGDEEISDAAVKNTYHVLQSNFMGEQEEYSEVAPLLLAGGKALLGGAGKAKEKAAEKKAAAEAEMMRKVLEQRRAEARKKAEAKKKQTNMLIIGSVVAVVAILGIVIYKSRAK